MVCSSSGWGVGLGRKLVEGGWGFGGEEGGGEQEGQVGGGEGVGHGVCSSALDQVPPPFAYG